MVDILDRARRIRLKAICGANYQPDRVMLASMAAHELREPAQAVQSFLSVVLDHRAGPLNETQADFLATARQAAQRMARRIEDVQAVLSESGSFGLQMAEVDLLLHARNCMNELEQIAGCYGVTLLLDVEAQTCPATIWADPERLDQILLNLIENAIRYAAHGTVARIIVRRTTSNAWAAVVQNQTDFPIKQDPSEWFSPYQRGDQSHSVGMGLGLTIAEHLARAHGGEIGAQVHGRSVSVGVVFPITEPYGPIPLQGTFGLEAEHI